MTIFEKAESCGEERLPKDTTAGSLLQNTRRRSIPVYCWHERSLKHAPPPNGSHGLYPEVTEGN
jgi:hypothetical protein